MRKKILRTAIYIAFSITNNIYAQNYTMYYQKIDSAKYYENLNDYKKADSLYLNCFKKYVGFADDYLSAISNNYKFTHTLNETYLIEGIKSGLLYKELKDELVIDSIRFSKFEIKKLYRKYHLVRSVNVMPIVRMLIKDQWARIREKNTNKADSLNAIRLTRLLRTNPDLFNRFKTGYIWSSILNIIILHSEWEYIEPVFYQLRDYVQLGYINREPLYTIIDRNSLFGGYLYCVDTTRNIIVIKKKGNIPVCPQYIYYSNLGQFYFYIKNIKKAYLVPVYPSITKEELNALRQYLFLSTIDTFLKTNPYLIVPSVDDFCNSRTLPPLK